MKTAIIQFNAGNNKKKNISRALALVKRAAQAKARFILLPEMFNFRGQVPREVLLSQVAENVPGESTLPLMDLARVKKVWIFAGSIHEKISGQKKVYNTSLLINPRGGIAAKYRKQNLFDAVIGHKVVNESLLFVSGNKFSTANVEGFKAGLSICYDLRFPKLYQAYSRRGCCVLTVPSIFTQVTGLAHWEVLLRARAIENLSYVLAPNQIGHNGRGISTFGNSMIVGPWGNVLARASGNREEIIFATLDENEVRSARKRLPGIFKK